MKPLLTRRKLLIVAGATWALLGGQTHARGRAKSSGTGGAAGRAVTSDAPALFQRVRSWAYQLQNYNLKALAGSDADLLVVDYSINGDSEKRLEGRTLDRLQRKPDGSRRLVLAYLSIGEAEDYRYYWRKEWIETAQPDVPVTEQPPVAVQNRADRKEPTGPTSGAAASRTVVRPAKPDRWLSPLAPPWLGDENDAWSGNFAVRYESPEWQAIFLDEPQSYLAQIIDAGFDGVYLDRVDAYYDHPDGLADAAQQMVTFVKRIAERARKLKPGFLIVPQNGEELLLRPGFVELIDGIAKEDLLFGSPTEGESNGRGQIANSVGWLGEAKRHGRKILVVEYLSDPEKIRVAAKQLSHLGYVATFAPRLLDQLSADAIPAALKAPQVP